MHLPIYNINCVYPVHFPICEICEICGQKHPVLFRVVRVFRG
jgi:hypothetical protein